MGRRRVNKRVALIETARLDLRRLLLTVYNLQIFVEYHNLNLGDDNYMRK